MLENIVSPRRAPRKTQISLCANVSSLLRPPQQGQPLEGPGAGNVVPFRDVGRETGTREPPAFSAERIVAVSEVTPPHVRAASESRGGGRDSPQAQPTGENAGSRPRPRPLDCSSYTRVSGVRGWEATGASRRARPAAPSSPPPPLVGRCSSHNGSHTYTATRSCATTMHRNVQECKKKNNWWGRETEEKKGLPAAPGGRELLAAAHKLSLAPAPGLRRGRGGRSPARSCEQMAALALPPCGWLHPGNYRRWGRDASLPRIMSQDK